MLCVILSTISHLTLSPLRGTKSLSTSETCTKCSSPRSSLRKPWPRDRQKYVTVPACTSPCTHGGVLLSTLNSLCAVMDTFLRDNGLIRILLLHLPNLLGSLLTYATLQRYSLQYFTSVQSVFIKDFSWLDMLQFIQCFLYFLLYWTKISLEKLH